MTTIETIISTIKANTKTIRQHKDYPNKPGLYAFSLAKSSKLKQFGDEGKIIYAGKAEDSLRQRDLNTHFKDGRTGNSTLRRSVGAILKVDFKAIAFSRNGTLNTPNIDNYKFDTKAEIELSRWMQENLLVGYWEFNFSLEDKVLREIEIDLIIALKPSLDLDKRTAKYNTHAVALTELRSICKDEARQNVKNKIRYY